MSRQGIFGLEVHSPNRLGEGGWEMTKTPEFQASLDAHIAKANEGVTHQEFAAGAQSGTIGFKCMIGEPQQFLSGTGKAIFNIFVLLYTIGPLILVSLWGYREQNAWLLLGIPISYAASYSARLRGRSSFSCFWRSASPSGSSSVSVLISTSPFSSSVRCGAIYSFS